MPGITRRELSFGWRVRQLPDRRGFPFSSRVEPRVRGMRI